MEKRKKLTLIELLTGPSVKEMVAEGRRLRTERLAKKHQKVET